MDNFPDPLAPLPSGIDPVLNWRKNDVEQRFGFAGGRFTNTNYNFTLFVSLALTCVIFAFLLYVADYITFPGLAVTKDMFTDRGFTPFPILMFSLWGLTIVFLKNRKLKFQRRVLDLAAVPQGPEFVINPETAKSVIERLETLVDDYRHFILFNRIHAAISNLKNLGQVSDVTNILRSQSNMDEDQIASSYALVNGFIWAIPVFGFLGTVLGLGQAMGGFGGTLKGGADMTQIRESLQTVTQGLSVAFDATLLGLVGTLALQLYATNTRRKEMDFLDECNDYCQTNVVAKLRLLPGDAR